MADYNEIQGDEIDDKELNQQIAKYPVGLYSKKQRLAVFGFLMLLTVLVLGLFCFGLLFFKSLSYYGYLFVVGAFVAMFIASLFPLFGKRVDKHFGIVKNWVFPFITVFLASLLLFFILAEYGILDLSPILNLFNGK